MIAYTTQGPVLDVEVGIPLNGYQLKSIVLTFKDTNNPEFLAWFAQVVTPRMSRHLTN